MASVAEGKMQRTGYPGQTANSLHVRESVLVSKVRVLTRCLYLEIDMTGVEALIIGLEVTQVLVLLVLLVAVTNSKGRGGD